MMKGSGSGDPNAEKSQIVAQELWHKNKKVWHLAMTWHHCMDEDGDQESRDTGSVRDP